MGRTLPCSRALLRCSAGALAAGLTLAAPPEPAPLAAQAAPAAASSALPSVPRFEIASSPEADPALLDGAAGSMARIRAAVDVLEGLWPTEWAPESLVALGQAGWRSELDPSTAVAELTRLHGTLVQEAEKVRTLTGGPALVARALAILEGR